VPYRARLLHWGRSGRSNPGLQYSPLRAATRREAFCDSTLKTVVKRGLVGVASAQQYYRDMRPVVLLIEPAPVGMTADFKDFTRIDVSAPAVSVLDRGVVRGDGVFETLGGVDGRVHNVEPHIERLAQSARALEIPEPNVEQWRAAIRETVSQLPRTGEFMLRLVLTRGVDGADDVPTAWIYGILSPDYSEARLNGISVVTLDRGYPRGIGTTAPWLLLGAKTLSYSVNMAALREGKHRGADDVIFVSHDGFAMEGPTSSIIFRKDGRYRTPECDTGILHGTTQQSVFHYLKSAGHTPEYGAVTTQELYDADALWLVSSVRLAVAVIALDGQAIPFDRDVTARFNDHLLERTGGSVSDVNRNGR
jgi:4-amino-4-deoxychorismate lyase